MASAAKYLKADRELKQILVALAQCGRALLRAHGRSAFAGGNIDFKELREEMTLETRLFERPPVCYEDPLSGIPLLVAALESASHAIVITDSFGVMQWVNAAFCKVTGYSRRELESRNIRMLNSGRHPREYFREMWNAPLRGRPWRGRIVNRRKDGTEYAHITTISPVRASGGRISHFLSVQQEDETPVLPDPRPSQTSEIAAAGHFACGIAPDLNGLLTLINRNKESMIAGPSGKVIRAGDDAATLAGWLLAFSRRQAQQFRDIDLNGLIRDMRRHLEAILPENTELKIALEPALRNLVGDEASLQEALIHLVVNARNAMRDEKGTLTLETATARQRGYGEAEGSVREFVSLRVTATGACNSLATHYRVFDPLDAASPDSSSAGLALTAVYGIVKQAGGWVTVRAEKGIGSSVEIFLPCSDSSDPADAGAWGGGE